MGVEPTGDGVTRRPPVLKTGTITGPHALPRRLDQITFGWNLLLTMDNHLMDYHE